KMSLAVRKCLSKNSSVQHDYVNSVLKRAGASNVTIANNNNSSILSDHHHIYIDIVFHVLSPLPGIMSENYDAIQKHLQHIVDSMNKDYNMQCSNFDNALTTD